MSVSSGSSGAIRAMGPSISGEQGSACPGLTLSWSREAGDELSLNPRVILFPTNVRHMKSYNHGSTG